VKVRTVTDPRLHCRRAFLAVKHGQPTNVNRTVHRSRRKSGRTVADVVPDVHYPGMRTVHRSRRKSGRTVADVVPDVHYPGMYRVKLPAEAPSDMVNLTRARDAALALAGQTLRDPSLAPVWTGLEDNLLHFHRPPKAFDGVDGRSIRRRQIRGVSQPFSAV
jgi:hypothetical protein